MTYRVIVNDVVSVQELYLVPRPALAATVHTVEARIQTSKLTCEQLLV